MKKGKISNEQLHGVLIPITTPMNSSGEIKIKSFEENLQRLARLTVGGFVICGSTGEMPYLRPDERLRLYKSARRIVKPPKLLIASTGLESTKETICLSRKAENLGVDLLLVITPNYFRSKMTSEALEAHYEAIAERIQIPLMIYSIPQFTGIKMDPSSIAKIGQHSNIIGIKESSGNASYAKRILQLAPPNFKVFLGSPMLLLKGLRWGSAGGILGISNFVPEICVGLYSAFLRKDWKRAQVLQRELSRLGRKINIPFGVAGVKAAMDHRGLIGGFVRSPLSPLTKKERSLVASLLKKYKALEDQ